MSATLAFSTVKPLSFSNENCLFSSFTTTSSSSSSSRSKSNHHQQQQQMSFNHRSRSKPTVVAYAGAAGVMERRKSSSSTTKTLYDVLRVKQNASPMEIKTAYRTLAKVYHPDAASESDGRDFMEIHNAYSILSDPSAKALYDLSLGGDLRRPFSYTGGAGSRYSSSSSSSSSSRGYTSTRRWETDQCW